MASVDQIAAAIAIGQGYFIQIQDFNTNALKFGFPTKFNERLVCLKRLMRALQWDINEQINDATTTAIYELLLDETAAYNGTGVVYNPNVIIPGQTVIVQTSGNFTQSGRIPFGPTPLLVIDNWSTNYYPTYGDNPEIQIFVGDNINGYQQDEQTAPVPVYPANDITQPLQSISWNFTIPTSGYYIISGKKPS